MKDRILKAIENHGKPMQTWQIASMIRSYEGTPIVLRRLKSLEKEGKVYRHESSKRNSIVWALKGYQIDL